MPDRSDDWGIGEVLRAARAERGWSLADLEDRTKIRIKYLAALEDERFGDLPPYPFARGFLRTVATELGLRPEPLVQRLAAAMTGGQTPSVDRLEGAIVPARPPSRLRRLVTMIAVVLLLLGGLLTVHVVRQVMQFGEPDPTALPSEVSPPAVTQGPTVSERPATEPSLGAAPAPQSPTAEEGVFVTLRASGLSWLRVVVDGERAFEGFVRDGEMRRWQGRRAITLRIGNAAAVTLTANGHDLGTLGRPGEVVERTFAR
jgi:cytoskeletal protein RodZ